MDFSETRVRGRRTIFFLGFLFRRMLLLLVFEALDFFLTALGASLEVFSSASVSNSAAGTQRLMFH